MAGPVEAASDPVVLPVGFPAVPPPRRRSRARRLLISDPGGYPVAARTAAANASPRWPYPLN